MAMKLKCLRSIGIDISKNPEVVCKTSSTEEMASLLDAITDNEVEYETWRRVEVDGKRKMKVVKEVCQKDKFVDMMLHEYTEFLEHVGRVTAQYTALKALKENLPKNELIAQMDFAENFTCGASDEIQSAYWNASSVSLHPVVVYFSGNGDKLEHMNFVYISDVLNHNAAAVTTIMKMLCAELRDLIPNANLIHYWTDSPSSQYRNRFIFDAIIHHTERFSGFRARWNYFESGHGKGPCDGLGGVAKRKASDAIKQGKACIQDAADFFNWAKASSGSIMYRFYANDDFQKSADEIKMTNPISLPGTMKVHAVLPRNTGLYSKATSCYCQCCINGENLCEGWKWQTMAKKADVETEKRGEEEQVEEESTREGIRSVIVPTKGGYIAAIYDRDWYVGKVLDIDEVDGDAKVSFMKKSKSSSSVLKYKWPQPPDEIWVDFDQIICKVNAPIPVGKSRRDFKLAEEDQALINGKLL